MILNITKWLTWSEVLISIEIELRVFIFRPWELHKNDKHTSRNSISNEIKSPKTNILISRTMFNRLR